MTPLALSSVWYWLLLGAVISYFCGNFNFAILIAKLKHHDIRKEGSGNPGSMNISRQLGLKYGIINFVCDGLKGGIPVVAGFLIFKNYYFAGTDFVSVSDFARYLFAVCAVLGHVFPVTMKFKGGKGIASTIGLFWCSISCEVWWYAFIGLAIWFLLFFYMYLTEWGSMGSLFGVAIYTIWQAIIFALRYSGIITNPYVIILFMFLFALNLLTWLKHYENLKRLVAGEEHHTSIKKMLHKKKKKS